MLLNYNTVSLNQILRLTLNLEFYFSKPKQGIFKMEDLKPLEDYNGTLSYRAMNDDEFRTAASYMHENDESERDYLSRHNISRDHAYTIVDEDGSRVIAFKSTSILPVIEGQEQPEGLPPGVGGVEIKPMFLRLDQDGDVKGSEANAKRYLELDDVDTFAVSSNSATTEEWQRVDSFMQIENLKKTVYDATRRAHLMYEHQMREESSRYLGIGAETGIKYREAHPEEAYTMENAIREMKGMDPTGENDDMYVVRNESTLYKKGEVQIAVAVLASTERGADGVNPRVKSMHVMQVDEAGEMKAVEDPKRALKNMGIKANDWVFEAEQSSPDNYAKLNDQVDPLSIARAIRERRKERLDEFNKLLEGPSIAPFDDNGFRNLGDTNDQWHARMLDSSDLHRINIAIENGYEIGKRLALGGTFEDKEDRSGYMLRNKVTGDSIVVTRASGLGYKNEIMTFEELPVVAKMESSARGTTLDENAALDLLGLDKEQLPKPVQHTLSSKDSFNSEYIEGVKNIAEGLRLESIRDKISQAQQEYTLPAEKKPATKDMRATVVGPPILYAAIEEYKESLAKESLKIGDDLEQMKNLDKIARKELTQEDYNRSYPKKLTTSYTEGIEKFEARREHVNEELTLAVIAPERFVLKKEGGLQLYDAVEAAKTLQKTKDGQFISLETPGNSGAIARHKVNADSHEDSAVLKQDDIVLNAVQVKAYPDDKETTIIYAVKSKYEADEESEGVWYNHIIAERVSPDGVVATNAEALEAVGLSEKDFQVTAYNNHRDRFESSPKDVGFSAQLSPAALREAMVTRQLSNMAQMAKDPVHNIKSNINPYIGYEVDPAEVDRAVEERNARAIRDIAFADRSGIQARDLSDKDVYYLNVASNSYDHPEGKQSLDTEAVLSKVRDYDGGVSIAINKKFIAEEYDFVNYHTKSYGFASNGERRSGGDPYAYGGWEDFQTSMLSSESNNPQQGVLLDKYGEVREYTGRPRIDSKQFLRVITGHQTHHSAYPDDKHPDAFRGEQPHELYTLADTVEKLGQEVEAAPEQPSIAVENDVQSAPKRKMR